MTLHSFDDLLRALREHPEWREQLRRQVLTDELLALPERVEALDEAMQWLRYRVERLQAAQRQGETDPDALAGKLGELRDDYLKRRYRDRASQLVAGLLYRGRPVPADELTAWVEDAGDAGQLRAGERADLLLSDLVLRGRDRETRAELYLVVEVAAAIGELEVERAARRAALLARLAPTRGAVAGEWLHARALERGRELGVRAVLDGAVIPPDHS